MSFFESFWSALSGPRMRLLEALAAVAWVLTSWVRPPDSDSNWEQD